jgi:hypothetical protein
LDAGPGAAVTDDYLGDVWCWVGIEAVSGVEPTPGPVKVRSGPSTRGPDSLEAVENQIEPELERAFFVRPGFRHVLLDVLGEIWEFAGWKSPKEDRGVVLEPLGADGVSDLPQRGSDDVARRPLRSRNPKWAHPPVTKVAGSKWMIRSTVHRMVGW